MQIKRKGNYTMKKLKKIPEFKNENEEYEFWSIHDSTEYLDWSKAKRVIFPNLKPTTKSIPIRFPLYMVEELKYLANRKNVPYQSLIKIYLEERLKRELNKKKKKVS